MDLGGTCCEAGRRKMDEVHGDQDNTSKTWADHEEMDRRHQRKNGQMMDAGGRSDAGTDQNRRKKGSIQEWMIKGC